MRISDWSSDVCSSDLGRQDQRRSRPHRRGFIALGRHMLAKLEHLVPRHLRIVCREVARLLTVIMVERRLPVRLDGQMATDETGSTAQVAGEAGHSVRSEERREGKEGISKCKTRWAAL